MTGSAERRSPVPNAPEVPQVPESHESLSAGDVATGSGTVAPWYPSHAPPEEPDLDYSEGEQLIKVFEATYSTPESDSIQLDDWQRWLFKQVLAKRPNGEYRHRVNIISMGRQNGKSLTGAAFALHGLLLQGKGRDVVSIASTTDQARIIFSRTSYAIDNSPILRRNIKKATEARGLRTNQGSTYKVMASRGSGLQGYSVSTAICDELHLLPEEAFDSLLIGIGQRPNSQIVGVTTAGDDSSTLLKRLYAQGKRNEIGFFLWEAPEDGTMEEKLIAANPAIASGRFPMKRALEEANLLPEIDRNRYRFNKFVAGVGEPWLSNDIWANALATQGGPRGRSGLVIGVDRTPDWSWVSFTAVEYDSDQGTHRIELLASLQEPRQQTIINTIQRLARYADAFVFDSYAMSTIGKRVKDLGYPVWMLNGSEINQAHSLAYARFLQEKISIERNDLLTFQALAAQKVHKNDGYRLDKKSEHGTDALTAMIMGLFVAESIGDRQYSQLF